MRRMIAATLVLIPVLAHAQASTTTEAKPSNASATLMAKSTPPAPPAAAKADVSPAKDSITVHETVTTQPDPAFLSEAMHDGGSISYTLIGSGEQIVAPKLVHVVSTTLPVDEIAVSRDVVVHLTVDQHGVPQNLKIARSADAIVDQRTLEAVSQYRFTPATIDNMSVPADVTIDVKIQK